MFSFEGHWINGGINTLCLVVVWSRVVLEEKNKEEIATIVVRVGSVGHADYY